MVYACIPFCFLSLVRVCINDGKKYLGHDGKLHSHENHVPMLCRVQQMNICNNKIHLDGSGLFFYM